MATFSEKVLLGLKVRQLRQELQLAFTDLSVRSGLSVSYLNEIEKGKKYPRDEKLHLLAQSLHTSPEWLRSADPGPHLAPVAALLQSNFLNELPLELFGIDPGRLLEMLAAAPLQVNAFVISLVELAQHHAVGTDHFYLSAMRAFQELNNNYFPELEAAAKACRAEYGLSNVACDVSSLKRILINHFGLRIHSNGLSAYPELSHLRSVYIPKSKELLLNPKMTEEQLLFQLAKEIGFQYQGLQPRPFASTVLTVTSFEQVSNNFKAGYFAIALLIDEWEFLSKLETAFNSPSFDPSIMLQWLEHYRVSPDILFQRFNVISVHWGLDAVFFHRLVYNKADDHYLIDKELHLHRVDRQYAGRPNEHYCRRWLSSRLIQTLSKDGASGPITGMVKMQYAGSDQSWLCLGIARASAFRPGEWSGLMIGVLINAASENRFQFMNDQSIPIDTVGMTCERCGIQDCQERGAPPYVLEKWQKKQRIKDRIKALTG